MFFVQQTGFVMKDVLYGDRQVALTHGTNPDEKHMKKRMLVFVEEISVRRTARAPWR